MVNRLFLDCVDAYRSERGRDTLEMNRASREVAS